MRRFFRFIFASCILSLLLVPVLRAVDWTRLGAALRGASLALLATAAAMGLVGCLGACTLRLGALLGALPSARPLRRLRLYELYIASAAAQIMLPSPAAEILRTVRLAQQYGYTLEDVTAAHIVEKAVDAMILSLGVLTLANIGQLLPWMRRPLIIFVAVSVGGLILLALFTQRTAATGNLSEDVATSLVHRVQRFLRHTLRSLAKFHAASTWGAALGWSCISEATNALTVGLVLSALGQASPVATCLAGSLTARLSGAIPLTPGQLGVQEGSVALVLTAFGVEPSRAMAAALLYRVVHAAPTLLVGSFALRHVVPKR